jgi:hypothetical protein
MSDYLHKQDKLLAEAGQDVAALSQEICETPAANALLSRFASLATKGTY